MTDLQVRNDIKLGKPHTGLEQCDEKELQLLVESEKPMPTKMKNRFSLNQFVYSGRYLVIKFLHTLD